jgi:rhamnosyl/mannosyltransferase
MRVLHCFKVYRPDHNGGIEEAMSRIVAGAPDDFESSMLVCRLRGPGSTIVVDGCEVERTTTYANVSSLPISPGYVLRMRQRIKDADVVVLHAPFPLSDIAIRGALGDNKGLVIHWHAEIVGRDLLRPVFDPLIAGSVRRADRVMVTDEAMVGISPHLRNVPEKCKAAPYGIDTGWWSQLTDRDRAAVSNLRSRYPRLVVGCGRLVPYKGFDVLIDAMARIDAHLILIGTGPNLEDLKNQADRIGVASRISFAGYVDRETQRQILTATNVFTLPSVTVAEAFGIAQVEAMCCGVPVVNTSLPTTVPRVARHELDGLTVPPGDAVALAAALSRLLDDPALAQRLGRAGQERAITHYDWRTYASVCTDIYRQTWKERRGKNG